jgi:hypothetical protein
VNVTVAVFGADARPVDAVEQAHAGRDANTAGQDQTVIHCRPSGK